MELVERVRAVLPGAQEKRMFGGVGFMVDGALACSVSTGGLLVRVGRDAQEALAARDGVGPMVMGGRVSRGWVVIEPRVVAGDDALREWTARGVDAARASLRKGR